MTWVVSTSEMFGSRQKKVGHCPHLGCSEPTAASGLQLLFKASISNVVHLIRSRSP